MELTLQEVRWIRFCHVDKIPRVLGPLSPLTPRAAPRRVPPRFCFKFKHTPMVLFRTEWIQIVAAQLGWGGGSCIQLEVTSLFQMSVSPERRTKWKWLEHTDHQPFWPNTLHVNIDLECESLCLSSVWLHNLTPYLQSIRRLNFGIVCFRSRSKNVIP